MTAALPAVPPRLSRRFAHVAEGAGPLAPLLQYVFSAPGKGLRPGLVIGWSEVGSRPPVAADVEDAAVAVELLHEASLLHDDICDRSPLRRGRPSAPAVFGARTAALGGAFLIGRALELLGGLAQRTGLHLELGFLKTLALGQAFEVVPGAMTVEGHRARYEEIVQAKTGALFALACDLGAQLSPSPTDALRESARAFADALGFAFQVLDDVRDLEGGAALGKAPGGDLARGLFTWPVLEWAAQTGDPDAALERARQATLSGMQESLRAEVLASGATQSSRRCAEDALQRARAQVAFRPRPGARALSELLNKVASA